MGFLHWIWWVLCVTEVRIPLVKPSSRVIASIAVDNIGALLLDEELLLSWWCAYQYLWVFLFTYEFLYWLQWGRHWLFSEHSLYFIVNSLCWRLLNRIIPACCFKCIFIGCSTHINLATHFLFGSWVFTVLIDLLKCTRNLCPLLCWNHYWSWGVALDRLVYKAAWLVEMRPTAFLSWYALFIITLHCVATWLKLLQLSVHVYWSL